MATSIFRDVNSVTTLMSIENQLTAALALDMIYRPDTTLNKKYGVATDYQPTAIPRIRYFGIGIKGYANLTSENNIAQPFMPKPTDCDLYEPIPFRCVQVPLGEEERAQYAMRTTKVIDDKTYYCYWLKKIEFESSTVRLTKVSDSVQEEYTMDAASLYPVPTDIYPTDVTSMSERITASITGLCKITGEEVVEVINAMYGGDMRRARISEIGTYSGIPFQYTNGSETYEEAAYVQLCTHKCTTGQIMSDPSAIYIERKTFENGSTVII